MKSSLADDAYAIIHGAIRSGQLQPAQRLRFADLQRMCGTSVSPVREALVRLTAEGFTTCDTHRGFTVMPISVDELMDIVANRILLEGEALRLSIRHGDIAWESRVVAAHHVLTRIPRERPDMPSVVREDWEPAHAAFHMALISASRSPILAELCEKLFVRADRYRRMSVSLPGQSRDVVREHADIMQAAVARDADRAVACLQAHYQATADQVRQLVGPG